MYAKIKQIGKVDNSYMSDPLSYCVTSDLDNSFNHTAGQKLGPYSAPCQMFMSDYCAKNWDGICEYASRNINSNYPNPMINSAPLVPNIGPNPTQGENLIRNTAMKKYLSQLSNNCTIDYEVFDPQVASSPLVGRIASKTKMTGAECIPVFEVNPDTIDSDIVMDKLLARPGVGMDILANIYNNAKAKGTLDRLKNTKLYRFFMSPDFQAYVILARNNASRLSGIRYR
jgi:hypothetical protein